MESSRARGDVLDLELSRSYDEMLEHARGSDHQFTIQVDDHDHHDDELTRDAYVRFQSPRALEETAARVAEIVQQQHHRGSGSTTQSRSSSPPPSPVMPRPGLRNMRSTYQFRSQRLLSMASDKSNGSNPSTASHELGSDHSHHHHHSHHSHSKDLHSRSHGKRAPRDANYSSAVHNCPSSHYYIDSQGHLQASRMWWLYTRIRRFLTHLVPGFKRDDNTFLCAPMISNTSLILMIYVLRLVINDATLTPLLTKSEQAECHEFSTNFLDVFSVSLLGNALLCLPAFSFSWCKLFKRVKPASKADLRSGRVPVNGALGMTPLGGVDATGAPMATAAAADGAVVHDDDQVKLRKTFLFTACELLVIVEIPYLVYTFIRIMFPTDVLADRTTEHTDLWSVTARCAQKLPVMVFITFLLAQLIGVTAYMLRWNQIILFHRMHEHFLYQRGCVPGRARFDYVEESFNRIFFASRRSKQIHEIKKRLYHAAKYGELDEVRAQIEAATAIDGPNFAHKWYDDNRFLSRCFGKRFVKCQRNPLHVAVAFDNVEVVQELLSNGMFDIQQVEKMELLKLNVSWMYRFYSDIIPMLRMSNYSRHKRRLVFGPVGLFSSTLLTPLHVAVSMGNTDMVLLLLRYRSDPNISAESSHRKFATPPLFWTINKECTRLLLDADANPLFVPGNGYFLTAFEVARLAGHHAVAMEIEKYGGDVALTPLHDACARGLKKEVRFYLEHGAHVDNLGEKVTGFFRRTPLHWAAIRGEAKIIKLLLRFGADVDTKDAFGRTPLMWACLLNRVKAVEMLLKYGADVDVRDIQGDPLLCICAAGTCASPSSAAFSSDAHHRGENGRRRRDDIGDSNGGGRGDQRQEFSVSQIAKTLDPDIFEMLQNCGIDLMATREANGDTALHVALRRNNEATAILFIRAGMSLTAVNYVGQRAMDCTMSSSLRYAIKKEAGHRDVMISYCHSHSALARKVRDALEAAYITTWIDSMDPSGITGGSVWRQEIAQGIRSSALVLALLTSDYPESQWCMKELAFAKMHNVPIVAIQCEDMQMTEELQVYLWTRQIVDFRPTVVERIVEVVKEEDEKKPKAKSKQSGHSNKPGEDSHHEDELLAQQDPRDAAAESTDGVLPQSNLVVKHEYDDEAFRNCMRLLLDGIHDQIEEHRVKRQQRQERQKMLLRARSRMHNDLGLASSSEEESEGEANHPDGEGTSRLHRQHDRPSNDGSVSRRDVVADEHRDGPPPSEKSPYVFIAHGDYHLHFCQKLRNSLQKQGIRVIVDHAVPSIQYAAAVGACVSSSPPSPKHLHRLHSVATNQSAGYGSSGEAATTTAQARQLAAKDAILDSTAVIVVLSPISAKCDMLTDQLAFAEDKGKLIVPLLLSLQTIDLAKRYTFSRSVVQHFNVSIGYDQSLERLTIYLQQATEAIIRKHQQKEAEMQLQLRAARRQRRRERERRRRQQAREGGADVASVVGSDDDAVDDGLSASPGSSPASSIRSSVSQTAGVRFISPIHFSSTATTIDSAHMPPTIPILQPARQPPTGATSGHGWSVGAPAPAPRDLSPSAHAAESAQTPQREPRHHFGSDPLRQRRTRSTSIHSPLPARRPDRLTPEKVKEPERWLV